MIRVVVLGKDKNGLFPYRIDGHWGPGGAPLIGLAFNPVEEAARVLHSLGVHPMAEIGFTAGKGRIVRTTIQALMDAHREVKALPWPERKRAGKAARKRLLVLGSGIPGDG